MGSFRWKGRRTSTLLTSDRSFFPEFSTQYGSAQSSFVSSACKSTGCMKWSFLSWWCQECPLKRLLGQNWAADSVKTFRLRTQIRNKFERHRAHFKRLYSRAIGQVYQFVDPWLVFGVLILPFKHFVARHRCLCRAGKPVGSGEDHWLSLLLSQIFFWSATVCKIIVLPKLLSALNMRLQEDYGRTHLFHHMIRTDIVLPLVAWGTC